MPERWAIYAGFHEVPDWALLIELMQEIRDHG
jgi:hypothetical protein